MIFYNEYFTTARLIDFAIILVLFDILAMGSQAFIADLNDGSGGRL